MKKFLLFFIVGLLAFTASMAQTGQKINMGTGAYADTLTNAQTKYYAAPSLKGYNYCAFQIYVDHLTGASDSCYVAIQGSIDGTNYQTLGSTVVANAALYTNTVTLTDAVCGTFKTCRFYAVDGGFIWSIDARMIFPWYRFAVTHYATGTTRVKGWMYVRP